MRVGCPKEIKNHEYRVGLTPESAGELVHQGHEVWIETGAGNGIGAYDEEYVAAGAKIVDGPGPDFRRVRDGGEGQGTAGRSSAPSCAKARSSTPICTSRPIPSRPPTSSSRASPRSPTRP